MRVNISLLGYKEMPKISDYNIPNYKEIKRGFWVKFHYMIDDKIKGTFHANLHGFEKDISVPYIKDENGELILDENGEYKREYIKFSPTKIRLEIRDDSEEEVMNLAKFMRGLKVGRKLYLRMGNESTDLDGLFDNKWTTNNDLECFTYVFDLTGSSNVLKF